ncbi:MAG: Crp/Fnr family transcriptional regulator [Chloroflexi bacterium]|nr:Crp/Fnr family transcriptional regulator [Chloroflexota bacterium]
MAATIDFHKLSAIPIFKNLSPETLAPLAASIRSVDLLAGEVLFHQGDIAKTLYLIEEGNIQIIREYDSKEEIILATLGPGEVVGDLSMIVGEPRTARVVATETTQLLALDRDTFFAAIGANPGMAVDVLVQLGLRLQAANLRIRELAATEPAARLASVILLLAEHDGVIKTGLVTASFHVQRVARAAGVDTKILKEILHEWSEEGFIGLDSRRLLLHDPSALQEIAGWA